MAIRQCPTCSEYIIGRHTCPPLFLVSLDPFVYPDQDEPNMEVYALNMQQAAEKYALQINTLWREHDARLVHVRRPQENGYTKYFVEPTWEPIYSAREM